MYPADEGVYLADEGMSIRLMKVSIWRAYPGGWGPGYGHQAWVAGLGSGHGDRGMGT